MSENTRRIPITATIMAKIMTMCWIAVDQVVLRRWAIKQLDNLDVTYESETKRTKALRYHFSVQLWDSLLTGRK